MILNADRKGSASWLLESVGLVQMIVDKTMMPHFDKAPPCGLDAI